jgi:hypothetical protein
VWSQTYRRGELFAKKYAARRRNGTVGSNGTNAPIAPITIERIPATIKSIFFTRLVK